MRADPGPGPRDGRPAGVRPGRPLLALPCPGPRRPESRPPVVRAAGRGGGSESEQCGTAAVWSGHVVGFSQRAGVADRRPGQFAGAPERGAVTGDDLGDGPHPYRRGLGETNQVRSEVAAEVDTGHGERRRDGQHDLGSAERSGGRVDLNHLADEPDPGDRGRQPQRCLREPGGQTGGQRVGAGLEPVGRCVDRVAGDPPYPGAVLHDRVTGPVLFERGDTELRDELGDPLVAVPEPGGAQVVPVDARQPAADAVACLHADDVEPGGPQRGGRGQPGRAGADNDDVVARSEGWHGRLLSEPESHAVGGWSGRSGSGPHRPAGP